LREYTVSFCLYEYLLVYYNRIIITNLNLYGIWSCIAAKKSYVPTFYHNERFFLFVIIWYIIYDIKRVKNLRKNWLDQSFFRWKYFVINTKPEVNNLASRITESDVPAYQIDNRKWDVFDVFIFDVLRIDNEYIEKFTDYPITDTPNNTSSLIYPLLLMIYEEDIERLIWYAEKDPSFSKEDMIFVKKFLYFMDSSRSKFKKLKEYQNMLNYLWIN
jgi:hypothetical protein